MTAHGNYVSETEVFFIFSDRTPVMPWQACTVLRTCLTQLGLDESVYGMHSLRAGRSQDLIKFGYTVDEVRMMGRWRSSCIYRYLK